METLGSKPIMIIFRRNVKNGSQKLFKNNQVKMTRQRQKLLNFLTYLSSMKAKKAVELQEYAQTS